MSAPRWYKRGPFRGRWIAPQRRRRMRLWCQYAIDKWNEDVVRDDHCGLPAHRACCLCDALTPNAPVLAR